MRVFLETLSNTFSFRNFSLSVDMDGSYGNKRLHARAGFIHMLNFNDYRGNGLKDRWKSEQEPGNGWRAGVLDNTSVIPSTNWMMDGSFFAIRNATLNYNLPNSILSRIGNIGGLKIYFNVTNILSIDEYWHMPQSASHNQTATQSSVDYRTGYPLARTYTLGIDIKF